MRVKVNLGNIELPKETTYNNLSLKNKLLFKKHNKCFGFNPHGLTIVKNGNYKKIVNLRFSLIGQYHDGDSKLHPSDELRKLGIKYMFWMPQTIGDQIWLLGCSNIPSELPSYITELELSKEDFKYWVGL